MPVVIDTSALMSIVLGEDDAPAFARAIAAHVGDLSISAATLVESTIVAETRQGLGATQDLELLLHRARIEVIPFDAAQASIAAGAWRRFGKGRHPAALNLGDCYSYALARHLNAELLFKGDDFTQTDVAAAL
ncbi:MAG: type II toxin-antitoxin system VapC family toxin [Microbacterium sp.]|uniref:type II toxin-antitoxin system VapC family toxin n=1 Tax=Microbacterium sp. TaxID=51671 RepID=UPI0039E65B4A